MEQFLHFGRTTYCIARTEGSQLFQLADYGLECAGADLWSDGPPLETQVYRVARGRLLLVTLEVRGPCRDLRVPVPTPPQSSPRNTGHREDIAAFRAWLETPEAREYMETRARVCPWPEILGTTPRRAQDQCDQPAYVYEKMNAPIPFTGGMLVVAGAYSPLWGRRPGGGAPGSLENLFNVRSLRELVFEEGRLVGAQSLSGWALQFRRLTRRMTGSHPQTSPPVGHRLADRLRPHLRFHYGLFG